MKILINGNTCTEIIRDKEIMSIDKWIGTLDKKQYKRLIIMLALVLPATTFDVFAQSEIIEVGYVFWDILKDIAYVICLLGAAIEAIKCVASGTVESLGKVGIKYLAFGLMFKFLPRIVAKIFSL